MKTITLIVVLAGLAPFAHATILRLDVEVNTVAFDSFESYENTTHQVLPVLGGAATFSGFDGMNPTTAYRVVNQDEGPSFNLASYGVASPRSGVQFGGATFGESKVVSLTFASPVWGFGGYYQFGDLNHMRTRFFDATGAEIDPGLSEYTERLNGNRFFLGWRSDSALIKRIDFMAGYDPEAQAVGHFHAVDDIMIFDSVPEPGTMAALGLGAAALLRRRKG